MRRREFIGLVGAATAWPVAAPAQRPAKVPIIGFLSPNSSVAAETWTTAFVQRLHDLGWDEGRTVQIEYRWEDGQVERTVEFVDELVSTSLSRTAWQTSLPQSKLHLRFRSSSRWRRSRSGVGLLRAFHDQAAMSRDCRFRLVISAASVSSYYERLYRGYTDWPSWETPAQS